MGLYTEENLAVGLYTGQDVSVRQYTEGLTSEDDARMCVQQIQKESLEGNMEDCM